MFPAPRRLDEMSLIVLPSLEIPRDYVTPNKVSIVAIT